MIPVSEPVRGMCEVYGFDPLYIANEGKMVVIVSESKSDETLRLLQKSDMGKNAAVIGRVAEKNPGKVVMKTQIGGTTLITMLGRRAVAEDLLSGIVIIVIVVIWL
jgi:hydrogenase expression/formation protein HypE